MNAPEHEPLALSHRRAHPRFRLRASLGAVWQAYNAVLMLIAVLLIGAFLFRGQLHAIDVRRSVANRPDQQGNAVIVSDFFEKGLRFITFRIQNRTMQAIEKASVSTAPLVPPGTEISVTYRVSDNGEIIITGWRPPTHREKPMIQLYSSYSTDRP